MARTRDSGRRCRPPRRARYNYAESPIALIARRKDKDGQQFLNADLVGAAERLREEFEVAQMAPKVTQNWDRFLTDDSSDDTTAKGDENSGAASARRRVSDALHDLGPGLGDIVLRVVCFLEGLEATERRMGWSARSGKIVLRIALQRLKQHYDGVSGGKLIG
ncbi:MAG: DUF6456 domain-containing protein [Paracoccaceae bacterium]